MSGRNAQADCDDSDSSSLLRLVLERDSEAIDRLFSKYRERLKRLVSLRLNRRLSRRVDGSDIIQDAFMEAAGKLEEYAANPRLPLFLWLRHLTCLKIAETHRNHLGTQKRNARREMFIGQRKTVDIDTASLAGLLATNSPNVSDELMATEQIQSMQRCLESLDPLDRELIALKHFEQMTMSEMAQVLEMPRATVERQYLRALKRMRSQLDP